MDEEVEERKIAALWKGKDVGDFEDIDVARNRRKPVLLLDEQPKRSKKQWEINFH